MLIPVPYIHRRIGLYLRIGYRIIDVQPSEIVRKYLMDYDRYTGILVFWRVAHDHQIKYGNVFRPESLQQMIPSAWEQTAPCLL